MPPSMVQRVSRSVSVKLTEAQFSRIRKASCKAGVSLSAYIRAAAESQVTGEEQEQRFLSTIRRHAREQSDADQRQMMIPEVSK